MAAITSPACFASLLRYIYRVSHTPINELNDRTRNIFRMVVESYLDSGAPVGSRTISKFPGLNLSPASIRNVMQDLEEAGLLAAPHTSAGRMPTESGLRLFVDGMMQAAEPSEAERRAIESQIKSDGPIEEALAAATSVLSGLSACAGIVLVPKRDAVMKSFSFARLSATQVLAIMVGTDNSVENRVVGIDPSVSDSALVEASNYIPAQMPGLRRAECFLPLHVDHRWQSAELEKVSEKGRGGANCTGPPAPSWRRLRVN